MKRKLDIDPDIVAMMVAEVAAGARARSAAEAYRDLAPASEASPLIANIGKRPAEAAQKRQTIPGATVTAWRSRLSGALRSNSKATRTAAGELTGTLDDATPTADRGGARG